MAHSDYNSYQRHNGIIVDGTGIYNPPPHLPSSIPINSNSFNPTNCDHDLYESYRNDMQIIAKNQYYFFLADFHQIYEKFVHKSFNNNKISQNMQQFILYFTDLFKVNNDNTMVISNIFQNNSHNSHPTTNSNYSMEELRESMIFIAQNECKFNLSQLPNIYSHYFYQDIKVQYKGKLKTLANYFYDIFDIHLNSFNNSTYLISKIYQNNNNNNNNHFNDTQSILQLRICMQCNDQNQMITLDVDKNELINNILYMIQQKIGISSNKLCLKYQNAVLNNDWNINQYNYISNGTQLVCIKINDNDNDNNNEYKQDIAPKNDNNNNNNSLIHALKLKNKEQQNEINQLNSQHITELAAVSSDANDEIRKYKMMYLEFKNETNDKIKTLQATNAELLVKLHQKQNELNSIKHNYITSDEGIKNNMNGIEQKSASNNNDISDICAQKFKYWLCNIVKLKQYLPIFIEHEYNDITLVEFFDFDIIYSELKITKKLHIKLILKRVEEYKEMISDFKKLLKFNNKLMIYQNKLTENGILTLCDLQNDIKTSNDVKNTLNIQNDIETKQILNEIYQNYTINSNNTNEGQVI